MVHFWNGTIVPEYFRKVPSIWFEIYSRMTNTKWHVSSKIHNQIHLDIKLSKEAGLPQHHLFIFSKKAIYLINTNVSFLRYTSTSFGTFWWLTSLFHSILDIWNRLLQSTRIGTLWSIWIVCYLLYGWPGKDKRYNYLDAFVAPLLL